MYDDGTAAAKQRRRAELLEARRAQSPEHRAAARARIRAHVLDHAAGVECVAGYVPLRTEPGSVELLRALHHAGAQVLVPITRPDRDLEWARWTRDGPGESRGVDAVSAAGLVLVPALAVAVDGTRLGRGGGSYDRALARCAPGAAVVALLFDNELVDRLPRDSWDRPVTAAVRPSGWTELGRNTGVVPGR